MKVVILAGGIGSRLFEETISKPKPMIEIGGMPLLWHLIKYYNYYNFNEFIILLGYKKEVIIDYFKKNYSFDGQQIIGGNVAWNFHASIENIKIKLVNSGVDTMTGGRLLYVKSLLYNQKFLLSYGDTLGNVNINDVISIHDKTNAIVTLTSVQPRSKYGVISFEKGTNSIKKFVEKPKLTNQWINGGFYVVDSKIFNYIKSIDNILEVDVFDKLIERTKISAFKHRGFWKSIETYKDKLELESLWINNNAAWRIWDENLGKAL